MMLYRTGKIPVQAMKAYDGVEMEPVAYQGILFRWGVQQIQVRTEITGIWVAVAPLVRGYGGSCNLVQEISFRIVIFS